MSTTDKTPPGFGHGKPWAIRVVEWTLKDEQEGSAMVSNGMPVHPKLHEIYWKEHATFSALFDVLKQLGQPMPTGFLLVGDDKRPFGYSFLRKDDGPEEIAWLSCFFAEMTDARCIAFPEMHEGVYERIAEIPGMRVAAMVRPS